MRGRTIYFQDRRILVFCGKKRIQPHSMNDRFGAAKEGALFGENAEIKNTDSVLTEAENGAAFGDSDEPLITTANARPLVDEDIALGENADGTSSGSSFAKTESGIALGQNIDGKAYILRRGKVDTDISIGKNAETLKTENPLFTEAVEDITAGSNADTFKTSVIKRDSAAAGLFIGDNVISKKYPDFLKANAKSGAAILQNVEGNVETPVATGDFVSFSSTEPFTIQTSNSTKSWNGTLEYSIDAETWTIWDGTSAIGNDTRLYIRGRNNTKITGSTGAKWNASATAAIKVQGVLETLLDYNTVAHGNMPNGDSYCFDRLFSGWDKLTDAGDLVIQTLNKVGYCRSLFRNCPALTKAPIFLGTQIAQYACYRMFQDDISLILPPQITITTINNDGCTQMFSGCTALVEPIKMAGVLSMPTNACFEMYKDCTSLVKLPTFAATSYQDGSFNSMFYGCSQIKLSVTQTGEYQNAYRIPSSGTGTSVNNPFAAMFYGTGGTFTGTPTINTTYYTSNEIIS